MFPLILYTSFILYDFSSKEITQDEKIKENDELKENLKDAKKENYWIK